MWLRLNFAITFFVLVTISSCVSDKDSSSATPQHISGIAFGTTTDNANNIYVTGRLSNSGSFLAKYRADGTMEWSSVTLRYTGQGIALDKYENLFTTDGTKYIGKYDQNRRLQWYQEISADGIFGVTTDSDANLLVVGYGIDTDCSCTPALDTFVRKYSSDGTLQWSTRIGAVRYALSVGAGIVIDKNNNIIISGYTNTALGTNTYAGQRDIFVAKISPNGQLTWVTQLGSANDEIATAIGTDNAGNAFVVGWISGSFTPYAGNGGRDVLLAKLNSDGNLLWIQQWGSSETDEATGVAVSNTGHVLVSGITTGEIDGYKNSGDQDVFVSMFDSDGLQQWSRQYGTLYTDVTNSSTVDTTGNFYVAGTSLHNGSDLNMLLIKYDPSGRGAIFE